MQKSNIDWCDMTWNPVTGCLHGCEYCYARKIANRFGTLEINPDNFSDSLNKILIQKHGVIVELNERLNGEPYPYDFVPTFHKYRLDEPLKKTKGKTIFVCSMADLFGNWVPDEWIEEVFKVCNEASQHTYMFLTKNPSRYAKLGAVGKLPHNNNFWYGSTITGNNETRFVSPKQDNPRYNTFLSIEPLLNLWDFNPYGEFDSIDWVIVGAQTGPGAVAPKKEWVQSIINQCRASNIPIFLKDNLKWSEKIQEYPW